MRHRAPPRSPKAAASARRPSPASQAGEPPRSFPHRNRLSHGKPPFANHFASDSGILGESDTRRIGRLSKLNVDCVYIAACARDARFARICVASIRYFYPDVHVRLLAADVLQRGLAEELHDYWGVELVDLPEGDYGWGFVQLEPLFGKPGERFLVLDVDTVLTGPVLDLWQDDSHFLVDNEQLSDSDRKRLYYNWEELAKIDPNVQSADTPFNSGQWFGTAGLVSRKEFDPWLEWTMPRKLRYPEYFMGGEQGVMNCVLLKKEALKGLRIERRTIMRWPGHSMEGLDPQSVAQRRAPPLVVHWAGMKKARVGAMVGGELLLHFEKFYYGRMPAGKLRRILATCQHFFIRWHHFVRVRVALAYRKWLRSSLLKSA
jgi:hypothetical protein